MCPGSIHLLGYVVNERFYFDVTLSMGSRSAAYCCQCTMNALSAAYNRFGFEDINYLDELGAAKEENRAEESYDCLGHVLATIGVEESRGKATPQQQGSIFGGLV